MIKLVLLSLFCGLSVGYPYYGPIEVPFKKSYQDFKVIRSPSYEPEKHVTEVKVGPVHMPVNMVFKSQASPIHVDMKHKRSKGSYTKSKSVDEPHKLVHEVVKPVYQEIKEIIKPFRKVTQVVEPVKEERLTLVHKGQRNSYDANQDGYNGGALRGISGLGIGVDHIPGQLNGQINGGYGGGNGDLMRGVDVEYLKGVGIRIGNNGGQMAASGGYGANVGSIGSDCDSDINNLRSGYSRGYYITH